MASKLTEKSKASAQAVAQRAKEALQHTISSAAPAVNKIEGGDKLFVLAVLPKGGVAAKNPGYLHCVEHALGLADWAKQHGATLVATNDKDRPNSSERLEVANKLTLIVTAGVGSDHIDLHAASDKSLTVAEITGSNTDSVAEHEILLSLNLLRNFVQGHEQIKKGVWDVCAATADAYDFKNKVVGTVGAGHIGQEYMRRVHKGWDAKELLYYGRHQKPKIEELGVKFEPNFDAFLGKCDVTDKTRGMFNSQTIGKMKRGAVLEALPEEYYIVREGKLAEAYT